MREMDELRGLSAGRLLALWRESRGEDPLERALLCNARILAECCYLRGERVYAGETEVLADLSARQMERLLLRLAEGETAPAAGAGNPAFDPARFAALEEMETG